MRTNRHGASLVFSTLLLAGMTAVGVSVAAQPSGAAPVDGRLAFAQDPDEGPLFTMNPDGTGLAQIGFGEHLQFSPDGTQVSFACSIGDHVSVCIANSDGTNVRRVVPDTTGLQQPPVDFYPRGWSPDGRLLLIDAGAGLSTRGAGIYTMHPDGSALTRLTATSSEQIPYGFSPDGTKISFIEPKGDGTTNLYVINADGSGQTKLNPSYLTLFDFSMFLVSWSPNSQRVAFSAFDSINRWGNGIAVFLVHTDGSGLHPLTPFGNTSQQPAWSPDGRWIAYQKSGGYGWPKVMVIHPDGSGSHAVTSPSAGLGANMVWSPDSQQLMLSYGPRPGYQFDIWTVRKDGSDLTQLTDTPGFDEAQDWGAAP